MGCLPSPLGRDPNGFSDWTFSTVRCWGEEAQGTYRLLIRDIGECCLPRGPQGGWQLCAMSQGAASSSPAQLREFPTGPTCFLPRRREPEAWHLEALAADPVRLLLVPSRDEGTAEVGQHTPSSLGARRGRLGLYPCLSSGLEPCCCQVRLGLSSHLTRQPWAVEYSSVC